MFGLINPNLPLPPTTFFWFSYRSEKSIIHSDLLFLKASYILRVCYHVPISLLHYRDNTNFPQTSQIVSCHSGFSPLISLPLAYIFPRINSITKGGSGGQKSQVLIKQGWRGRGGTGIKAPRLLVHVLYTTVNTSPRKDLLFLQQHDIADTYSVCGLL